MKILLADDSVLILERLQQMLAGIDQVEIVASLNNGIDALDSLRTFNPDVAILDIRMPGLSGIEVLNTFKKENKSVIFIILTLHSQSYFRQMAIKAGSNYFFNKADDFEKISSIVNGLCENRKEEIINS
ncbi:MAG TPA: response regulator [Prolixibacteraceae bacterium]|nr:response regulator [Prolixibacteraceae bacterium]